MCLLPFILEHVREWIACIDEALRVLKPGGLIFISTTNWLCPRQDEFNLPMYSWYPAPLKRYYERRAVGDWPALVNHAKYPAVNWFNIYELRDYLASNGCDTFGRFELMTTDGRSLGARTLLTLLRRSKLFNFAAQIFTPFTLVVGRKSIEPAL